MVAVFMMGLALTTPAANTTASSGDSMRLQAEDTFREAVQLAPQQPNEARMCFACAAALYERLLSTEAGNPALYRNLGNAYLLAHDPDDKQGDDLARAILAYQRGLRLAPNDRQLHINLDYARQQVVYPVGNPFGQPPIDHRPPWLPRWPGALFGLAATGYGCMFLCVARWWMVRRWNWLTAAGSCALVSLLLLAAGSLEYWLMVQETRTPLVVIARDGTRLLSGNGSRYPPKYETAVNRGVEARLLYDRGRWLQIELAGGEIGWVPRDGVLVDR